MRMLIFFLNLVALASVPFKLMVHGSNSNGLDLSNKRKIKATKTPSILKKISASKDDGVVYLSYEGNYLKFSKLGKTLRLSPHKIPWTIRMHKKNTENFNQEHIFFESNHLCLTLLTEDNSFKGKKCDDKNVNQQFHTIEYEKVMHKNTDRRYKVINLHRPRRPNFTKSMKTYRKRVPVKLDDDVEEVEQTTDEESTENDPQPAKTLKIDFTASVGKPEERKNPDAEVIYKAVKDAFKDSNLNNTSTVTVPSIPQIQALSLPTQLYAPFQKPNEPMTNQPIPVLGVVAPPAQIDGSVEALARKPRSIKYFDDPNKKGGNLHKRAITSSSETEQDDLLKEFENFKRDRRKKQKQKQKQKRESGNENKENKEIRDNDKKNYGDIFNEAIDKGINGIDDFVQSSEGSLKKSAARLKNLLSRFFRDFNEKDENEDDNAKAQTLNSNERNEFAKLMQEMKKYKQNNAKPYNGGINYNFNENSRKNMDMNVPKSAKINDSGDLEQTIEELRRFGSTSLERVDKSNYDGGICYQNGKCAGPGTQRNGIVNQQNSASNGYRKNSANKGMGGNYNTAPMPNLNPQQIPFNRPMPLQAKFDSIQSSSAPNQKQLVNVTPSEIASNLPCPNNLLGPPSSANSISCANTIGSTLSDNQDIS